MNRDFSEALPFSEQYTETMRSVLSDFQKGRLYWDSVIRQYLPNNLVDNLTDFSDSTCFTYFICCDGSQYEIGTKELSAYLKAGNDAYYVKMQISTLAPIMCISFCMYEKSPHAFCLCEKPFTPSQQDVYAAIKRFAEDHNIQIIKMSALTNSNAATSGKAGNAYSNLFEPNE